MSRRSWRSTTARMRTRPPKRYAINDLQASLKGLGQIDVAFQPGETDGANRDELRNIRLMGDLLEFELFHQSAYGPVTFQLRGK